MTQTKTPVTLAPALVSAAARRLVARAVCIAVVALTTAPLMAQAQEKSTEPGPPHSPRVDVFHWWVTGGERASVDVIRDAALAQGIGWTEASTVGSGTARYTRVLDQRVRAGKAPSAAQMIGYDIHAWAA